MKTKYIKDKIYIYMYKILIAEGLFVRWNNNYNNNNNNNNIKKDQLFFVALKLWMNIFYYFLHMIEVIFNLYKSYIGR